jgi:hypothetical protein
MVLLPCTCRNHIPEKKGTWMEEWHQKLHNNTTPDDVPICSAYIAFLEVRMEAFAEPQVKQHAMVTTLSTHGLCGAQCAVLECNSCWPFLFLGK